MDVEQAILSDIEMQPQLNYVDLWNVQGVVLSTVQRYNHTTILQTFYIRALFLKKYFTFNFECFRYKLF